MDINDKANDIKSNQQENQDNYKKNKVELEKMLQQIKLDINANRPTSKQFTTKYTKEQVQRYLESPRKYEKELRAIVKSLCVLSPQFNRLVEYLPDMAMFCYRLIPTDVSTNKNKAKKDFIKWTKYVDKLNIQDEFIKVIKSNYKYDVYFGYTLEESNGFYIKTLDADYCKITSINDGCFDFAFDFSYFDGYENKQYLPYYPKEFQTKYKLYRDDTSNMRWQELSSENTICTKFYKDMEDIVYPPYCNTFSDLYDISDYKQLDKQSAENENYQLIGLQLETINGAKEANSFAVDPTTATEYWSLIQQSLPDGIGAFLTPVKWDTANFSNSSQNKMDRVENSTRNFWDGAGIASALFSNSADTGSTLKYSMLVDTNMLFVIYRQLERWLNRKLKNQFGGKVAIQLLDIHRLNQQDFIDNILSLAQYGLPVKSTLCCAIGLSPLQMLTLNNYENDVLELDKQFIPLQSSYTQSGNSNNNDAKPTLDDTQISDAGMKNKDNNNNDNTNA